MAEISYLSSTLLMGLFLIAILVIIARLRIESGASAATGERSTSAELPDVPAGDLASSHRQPATDTETPLSWVVGFLVVVLVVVAGAALFLGGVSLSASNTRLAGIVLALVLGGLLGGYLFSGVYLSVRSHGRVRSEATGVALWILGLLFVLLIAVKLIMAQ